MRHLLSLLCVIIFTSPITAKELSKITVVGQGSVSAVPDMATISLGVLTLGKTASQALSENSTAMQNVFNALEENRLDKKDIQTSQLTLNPQWDRRNNNGHQPKIIGYQAINNVSVRVRDLDNLGMVLDQLSKVGANNMNGISFGLQETESSLNDARRDAVKVAREKAELYAQAAGVTLGKIISINESTGSSPRPSMRMAEAAMMDSVPIAEGTLTISAMVTLVFAISE